MAENDPRMVRYSPRRLLGNQGRPWLPTRVYLRRLSTATVRDVSTRVQSGNRVHFGRKV